uniref:Uncharacterized protein n=1 Tax=Anguilla anguilla TaxID=7936 RepID=A0A0E9PWG8_ANGAN
MAQLFFFKLSFMHHYLHIQMQNESLVKGQASFQ